jgi:peroxiredoxin
MAAEIGQPAPDFTLVDRNRETVSLDDLKGKKSLIVFIPFPFTGTCTDEVCELRDNLAQLGELDANVVVITVHARPTNAAWAEQEGLDFPVLADYWPHGAVTQAYGAFDEATGAATRSTYVLDEAGVVRAIVATDSLGTPREYAAYTEALAAI